MVFCILGCCRLNKSQLHACYQSSPLSLNIRGKVTLKILTQIPDQQIKYICCLSRLHFLPHLVLILVLTRENCNPVVSNERNKSESCDSYILTRNVLRRKAKKRGPEEWCFYKQIIIKKMTSHNYIKVRSEYFRNLYQLNLIIGDGVKGIIFILLEHNWYRNFQLLYLYQKVS